MADIVELHRDALAVTRSIVASVQPEHLDRPTPCGDWTVRELLNHIVSGNWWVIELVGGRSIEEVGDALDGDLLGDDPLGAYVESAGAADAAFSAPGAMEAPCAVSYGPIPGEAYAGDRFVDVLIHGWDLAVAIGHDSTLDPTLVEACWNLVEPHAAMLRGSGQFGGDVEVATDSSPQVRLLALLGRQT